MAETKFFNKIDSAYFQASREKLGEVEYLVCKIDKSDSERMELWKSAGISYLKDQNSKGKDIAVALIDLSENTTPPTKERKLATLFILTFADELKFKTVNAFVVRPNKKNDRILERMFNNMVSLALKFAMKKYDLKVEFVKDMNEGRKRIFDLVMKCSFS